MSIASGQAITGIDAGVYTPVTVEGSVFVDAGDTGYFEARRGADWRRWRHHPQLCGDH